MKYQSQFDNFSRFVHPSFLPAIKKNISELATIILEKESTIVYTGIGNFHELGRYLTPKDFIDFINKYYGLLFNAILENKGSFVDFRGDEISAIFGAPIYYEGHAINACECCLQLRKAFNDILGCYPAVKSIANLEIGINSGFCSSGFLGSTMFQKFIILGDQVNLAGRCQASSKQYGEWCVVTENIVNKCMDKYVFKHIGEFELYGKPTPMKLFGLQCGK